MQNWFDKILLLQKMGVRPPSSMTLTNLCEGRVAIPATNLMNHPLDHNSIFGGVVVARSVASRHRHSKDWNLTLDVTC
jgi:hypothetical protein